MKNKAFFLMIGVMLFGGQLLAQAISPYLSVGNKRAITQLLFAKKGSLLISLDKGGKCVIWDFFERREINNIALNKDDDIVIVNDTVLYCKNKKEYRTLPQLTLLENYQAAPGKSAAGPYSIVSKSDRLKLYHNGVLLQVLGGISAGFTGYAISSNDSLLATTCGDHYLILRKLKDPIAYRQIDVGATALKVAFHSIIPRLAAVGTESGEIKIYDVKNHEYIFSFASDLLNAFAVQEDIHHKNIVISTIDNSYIFNYRDLQFTQFSLPFVKLKHDETYLQLYDDSSRSSVFYYWKNNHTLTKFSHDTAIRIASYGGAEFYEKDISLLGPNDGGRSGTLIPQPVTGKKGYYQAPDLQYQDNWDITYDIRGKVILRKGDEKKTYRSTGENGVAFAQDDSTIVTLRNPAYVNLISKYDRFKPVNYFLYESDTINSRICTVSNSFFAIQDKNCFRILKRTGNHLKVVNKLKGNFINSGADGGEFYYSRDSSVIIHNLSLNNETSLSANINSNLLFVKKIVINNKVFGYLLFYDGGFIEYLSATDKLIGTFYCYNNGEFIFMLPDNSFFSSSKTLLQKVILKSGSDIYQLDQFEAEFNRPDLVMRKVGFISNDKIKIYADAYQKYLQKIPSTKGISTTGLPTAEIANWNDNYATSDSVISVNCHFASARSMLKKVNIYVNSVPLFDKLGIDLSQRQLSKFDTTLVIKLSAGDNLVKPVAIAINGTKNFVKSYYIKAEYRARPHVYFLGIAANHFRDKSHDLVYAEKDIIALAASLKKRYGAAITIDTLFNKNVTNQSLQQKIAALRSVNINDKVIIYYSGHGLLGKNNDYYFSSYDVNFDEPEQNGILYDDVENAIDKIPSRNKIFFIDACNSGELDNAEIIASQSSPNKGAREGKNQPRKKLDNSFYVMQDIFSDFSQGTGTIIISAARGDQSAQEGEQWNHGAFTYSILKGLENNRADLNKDGVITVSELKSYVSRTVSEITRGDQRPTSRKDVLDYDWSF